LLRRGLVLWPENIAALKENGILICLEADPEDIFGRVSRKKGTRPLLKKNYNVDDIRELLKAREEYYNCADFKVNTSGKDLDMVVNEICINIGASDDIPLFCLIHQPA
jgi:shikimate kinase